jgi:hypothetical protein
VEQREAGMKKAIETLRAAKIIILGLIGDENDPAFIAYDLLEEAIEELKPRWETPEQYQKRTGKLWPDNGAVYTLYEDNDSDNRWWFCESYYYASTGVCAGNRLVAIICATEAGPPPKDWEPEEVK